MQAVATRERDAPAGVLYCYECVKSKVKLYTRLLSAGGGETAGWAEARRHVPGVGEPSAVFLLRHTLTSALLDYLVKTRTHDPTHELMP